MPLSDSASRPKPELPDVTLCCIDTRQPDIALRALHESQKHCRFGATLLLTDTPIAAPGVDVRMIAPITGMEDYSAFVLKGLLPHISTSHVLLVQWDGYVIDGTRWEPGFLDFDYIGAPWPWAEPNQQVGNGGFSLRSRRLLELLAQDDFPVRHPEDLYIGRDWRPELERRGIRFADVETASRFAFERDRQMEDGRVAFGFHGLFNFWRVIPPAELEAFLDRLPASVFREQEVSDLVLNLLKRGRVEEARTLLEIYEARLGEGAALGVFAHLGASDLGESLRRLVLGPLPSRERPAAPASGITDSQGAARSAVLVLGMHRSGTSSVAGTLIELGAAAPLTLMPATADNERGFFESMALMDLNAEILEAVGSVWHDWRPLDLDRLSSQDRASFVDMAARTLTSEFGGASLIAVKDPRMCRMVPLWRDAFERAGYGVHAILPLRSPLEVARSLERRNGFPIGKGLLLWLRHVLDAEAATRDMPRCILPWEDLLTDWRSALARVAAETGLIWPRPVEEAAAAIDDYLAPSLRHNVADAAQLATHPDVNIWVLQTCEALQILAAHPGSGRARRMLDAVRAEFDAAAGLFGGYIRALEQTGDSLRADLHATHHAIHQVLTNAAAERAAAAAQLAEMVAARDATQERVEVLTRAQEALSAELEALHAELAVARAPAPTHLGRSLAWLRQRLRTR